MKRMSFMVMALAMVLGFTQCKKDQPTNQNAENLVPITLTVAGGNGSKVIVNPTGHTDPDYATVTFEDDDVIYVGYNNKYVGTLTYSGGAFSGSVSIDEPVGSQPLHFYFLGGKGFTPSVVGDEATVVISDQTEKYPVISYAPSKEEYTGTGTYTAKLQNKMSIMKFNVTTPSTAAICITGMNNKVTVDFTDPNDADNGFSYDKDGEGIIKMAGGSGEPAVKWAIVLPQTALAEGALGTTYSEDNNYFGTRPEMDAITSNTYLNTGKAMSVNIGSGALPGLFSVSSTKQVHFSQGNLQYQASTDTWRFAENQWNFVGGTFGGNTYGNVAGSSNDEISSTYSGWIDMFGWGCTGHQDTEHNSNQLYYQPYETNTNGDYYGPTGSYNLSVTNHSDWGYNSIANSYGKDWYTLSSSEWVYLFGDSEKRTGKYAFATIGSEYVGLILLPDEWTLPEGCSFISGGASGWSTNTYTFEQWENMQNNGAVFLLYAGYRSGIEYSFYPVNGYLMYWSSSCFGTSCGGAITASPMYCEFNDFYNRSQGMPVRLVCE